MDNQPNQNDVNQEQLQPNQNDVPYVNQAPLQVQKGGGNGLGVASMVVGIIAIIGSWIPLVNFFSLILGIVALGLGIGGLVVSRNGSRSKGTSFAGLILSIITILIFLSMYL